ncbi:kinesin-like protein [Lentinula aciculospora]|uniref:Kinesin-like protein n=1 Tax=Lentinula aciculospora TaxID=153920 RepID=A0A9W9A0B1_9AGAR|nr:kinesin-like protein [Lentinula aciculospora]
MATRSSARTKAHVAAPAPTTRTTRAKAENTTTTKATSPPSLPVPPPPKKAASRKPLTSRSNNDGLSDPPSKPPSKSVAGARKLAKVKANVVEAEREPIMAYLRVRPNVNEDDEVSPYLTQLSDTSVRMTDPNQEHQNPSSRFRSSTVTPSSTYTFCHIFPPSTTQGDFFTSTTLPLVRDVLEGQNALLFTYGVTNSGKTYTVQGGSSAGSAGILPRSLDVIFNSIEGLHGSNKYRPIRLYGVELADASDLKPPPTVPEPAVAQVLGSQMSNSASAMDIDVDTTALKLDRNYEYTIWLSYAEVYNEKVYDLLDSVHDESSRQKPSGIPRSGAASSLVLTRNALLVKSSPSFDNSDSEVGGKYISGLRQFRIETAAQAKELLRLGQLHRRVFGTLANKESSRSHGMVILKIMRCHRGEKNDPTAIQISRFTLVDLAGSERTKHTHTTGDRLKEAGNINNSLMVLGQCLQVLRSNQRKVAVSLSQEGEGKAGRVDTRDIKQTLTIVPFRHSKLTEILMDYFAGDGRVVMIVNVNPYDTGYDENSHVMKFAALAREVYVSPTPVPAQRAPTVGPGKTSGKTIRQLGPLTLNDPDIAPKPFSRKVTISIDGNNHGGRKASEAVLEVLEVPEPDDETGEEEQADDVPINPLVDALFDEIEYLRLQLYESEMRSALVEAEVRDEVMREMETRMADMEDMYTRRLAKEIEQHEAKTDAKLDMLQQTGFRSPVKKAQPQRSRTDWSDEEEDVGLSFVQEEEEGNSSENSSGEEFDFGVRKDSEISDTSPPKKERKASAKPSPAKRQSTASQKIREPRPFIPDGPMLPSDSEDAEMTGTEAGDETEEGEREEGEDEDEESVPASDSESEGGDDDKEWAPSVPTPRAVKPPPRASSPSPTRQKIPQPKFLTNRNRISMAEERLKNLDLDDDFANDDSMIIPSRQSRGRQVGGSGPRKVKRLVGSTPVIREEQIEQISLAMDKRSGGKTVRRLLT